MEALAGPYYAAALLVAAAGALKLARPAATVTSLRAAKLPGSTALVRGLGAAELAVAAAALTAGRGGAAVLAATYAGFALYARFAASRAASCGCFGSAATPLGGLHVAVNLALAGLAAVVAAAPLPGLGEVLAAQPAAAIPFGLLVAATAYLLYLSTTRYAELRRLVHR